MPEKKAIWRVDRGCERKSILCDWRGVPSHKRARVHNNLKSEHLLLKQKVCRLILSNNRVVEIFNHLLINRGQFILTYYDVSLDRYGNYFVWWPHSLLKNFSVLIKLSLPRLFFVRTTYNMVCSKSYNDNHEHINTNCNIG